MSEIQDLKMKFEFEVADGKSTERVLLALSDCEDVTPRTICDSLDVPQGSTYKQGVASIREESAVARQILASEK